MVRELFELVSRFSDEAAAAEIDFEQAVDDLIDTLKTSNRQTAEKLLTTLGFSTDCLADDPSELRRQLVSLEIQTHCD